MKCELTNATTCELYWDEDNRLMVLSDNGKTSRYTYNHAGERAVKSHGSMEGVYINGAPQGITFHETDEYTLYPASIISVNKNRYTKHYFIGDKRIASRIGSGSFNNIYGQNGSFLTAGQQDYAERINQIETQREDYYRELGIAPGIPTMKGSYGDPENTGVGYNTIIKELGDHSVPAEWAQYVKHNEVEGSTPGAPIQWDDPSDPESAQPGYGFVADNSTEEETFYYHSDHLGSTSYITDGNGNITQYDAYLPYGELLVDEHSSSEEMPYKFNGKELDEETGLYYYGARYMQPVASIWYGVDPLAEKFASVSGYTYCLGNPIKLVDTDGNWPFKWQAQVSRRLYNLFHKTKAGPVYKNENAKSSKYRYAYNVSRMTENGEFEVTTNYRFDTEWTKTTQNIGDGIALVGYGATLTGVGAEVGAPVATIGEEVSALGAGAEITLDLLNGEYGDSFKGFMYYAVEKTIEKSIKKIMPGNVGPESKDIAKYIIGKLKGHGKGKQILDQDFNLGKAVLTQGASLKTKIAEHTIDTVIERNEQKQDSPEE